MAGRRANNDGRRDAHLFAVVVGIGVALLHVALAAVGSADVLVADRLTSSVYRYSDAGDFLNVVARGTDAQTQAVFLNQPTGLALSPDGGQLYVSSSQTNSVVRYNYDSATGTAADPVIFATQDDGLQFPSSIVFGPQGGSIYVSNLGGTGVARFNLDGSGAGPPLGPFGGGAFNQFSGLGWSPTGELLVGGFVDTPGGAQGAVGKSNAGVDALATFIGPHPSLMGASGVLVHEGYAYVTGMFAGNLQRFRVADGSIDATFSISGLEFPQGLALAPDGNGLLVGVLGYANGAGHIAHYDFDGNPVADGVFARADEGGFHEATAFVIAPNFPGDFNGDRAVDGEDLAAWSQNLGDLSGQAARGDGDADANGVVDGADLLVWQRHLQPGITAGISAVPEPAGLALMALAISALLGKRP